MSPPPFGNPERRDGQGQRLSAIDAARGVAALLVVAFHIAMVWGNGPHFGWNRLVAAAGVVAWPFALLARHGALGVSLFLVLSGFCLHYPTACGKPPLTVREFAWRRLLRIGPAYYASLLALWCFVPIFPGLAYGPITTFDLTTHLLLVHNWFKATLWSVNGVYWSLALEVQLYGFYPLLAYLARRSGVAVMLICAAATTGAWFYWGTTLSATLLTGAGWAVFHEAPPARLLEFALGMTVAELAARGHRLPRKSVLVAAVAIVATAEWRFNRALDWVFAERLVTAFGFAACVWVAASQHAESASTVFGRAQTLVLRALAGIGVFSYSLYLVHQPLLLLARPLVPWFRLHTGLPFGWLGLVALAPLLLFSWLWYRAFERPFMRFRRA